MKLKDAICTVSGVGMLLILAYCAIGQQRKRLSNDEVCRMNLKDLATAIHNFDSEVQISEERSESHLPLQDTMTPRALFQEISRRELIRPRILICPTDIRVPADSITNIYATNLSYFLSQRLGDSHGKRIIAGDRNIAGMPADLPFRSGTVRWLSTPVMHTNAGWLVLSDTTVFRATNGTALVGGVDRINRTNRLFIP